MMNWSWAFPFDFAGFGGDGPRSQRRGPRRGFFRSGEVRLALLSLLDEAPGHGYDLMKRLEGRSGGLYKASAGTVYPVLQQLEDEGRVRSHEEDGKKVYHITDEGRAEVRGADDRVSGIWSRADRWKEWGCRMGPDTVGIAMAMGRLARSAFTVGADTQKVADEVTDIIERARRDIEAMAETRAEAKAGR
ncbi:MAG: PadR family transcriptional regulator [Gemmatimonadetes bacterium]|nr:PadR family transcriptional regulator [Gemmatimonadota bacterium]MBT8404266.1 PadR family transcriptional regulator [Gemmatimonadota bacterium]